MPTPTPGQISKVILAAQVANQAAADAIALCLRGGNGTEQQSADQARYAAWAVQGTADVAAYEEVGL